MSPGPLNDGREGAREPISRAAPHRRAERRCEDCGEPATRETADGVWLCEGEFDALLDAAFWDEE